MTDNKVNVNKIVSVMLLNFGALSWFFVLNLYIEEIFDIMTPSASNWGSFIGNSLFYGSIIFWSIAISFIRNRINRRKLLFISIILGILSTVFLGFFEGTFLASITSFLMGTSLGIGLPSSLALVADYTNVEKRGRFSGIIVLGTFIIGFICMVLIRILTLDFLEIILLLVILRSISLFAIVMEKFDRPITIEKSRIRIYEYKDFIIYFFPWIMFALASSLGWTLIPEGSYVYEVDFGKNILRYVFIAVFGLVSGFLADRFGRKQPIIIGLISFGIGFFQLSNLSGMSVYLYSMLSGITWGSFFVVFLAVPGDLSVPSSREKFYALGYILPLIGVFAISAIPVQSLPDILSSSSISQILTICFFLPIYPLWRAKETLTESKIQERKIKQHINRIGKFVRDTEEEKG